MSDLAHRPSHIHPRDDDERLRQPCSSTPTQSASGDQSNESAAAPSASACPAVDDQPADAQPLPEQMRKKQRLSPPFCRSLDRLATVELQLCLQFLDTKSKLIAARCSRSLLQAADHPFAWQGLAVAFSLTSRPQLGTLIGQSLLRHAPIALRLGSDLPAAQVAAIPRLRELVLLSRCSADVALQVLTLPSLQDLRSLHVFSSLPLSTLQLLPALPVLHTLEFKYFVNHSDWSWISQTTMPALTELHLVGGSYSLPQPSFDAIGQCARLQSLRLCRPFFVADDFARLCSSPALCQLRHLEIGSWRNAGALQSDEWCAAFSALTALESLHLKRVSGVDRLLPHLVHAPALRTLTIACAPDPDDSNSIQWHGPVPANPRHAVLRQLLAAAPQLQVRLLVAASIEKWRDSIQYRLASASHRKKMNKKWHTLRRMPAEIERVTIIDPRDD